VIEPKLGSASFDLEYKDMGVMYMLIVLNYMF